MNEFDVETTGLQWYAHDVFLAQFLTDGAGPDVMKHPADRDSVQHYLRSSKDGYRAWNSKFDLHFLDAAGYDLPPEDQWHDGMVLAKIVDERPSAALKARGEALFGPAERDLEGQVKDALKELTKARRKASKADGTEFVAPNYGDVDDALMRAYAAQDVVLQRKVCDQLEAVVAMKPDLQELYELERKVLAALFHVEKRGLPVDPELAHRFERELLENVEGLEDEAVEMVGKSNFKIRSSPQLYEALERLGADLTFVTGKSMDEENLSTVDHPLAAQVLRYRSEYKVLSTYLRPLLHGPGKSGLDAPFLQDGRVHANYRQVGTRTGRMSASDPNVQNWTRDDLRLRYLVHARPGKKLVAVDLDNVELRMLAMFAGDGAMKRAIEAGTDMHAQTAEFLGLQDKQRATGVEVARQRGKKMNYLIVYGGGVRAVRKWFGVNQEGGRDLLRRFHQAYPEISALQDRVQAKAEDQGFLKSPWGRRHRITPREAYKGVNYLSQGTAADLFKAALARLHTAGVPVVGLFHDEILAEVDAADAEDAKQEIIEALTDHPRITEYIPLEADGAVVDRWSEAKDPAFVPGYATKGT